MLLDLKPIFVPMVYEHVSNPRDSPALDHESGEAWDHHEESGDDVLLQALVDKHTVDIKAVQVQRSSKNAKNNILFKISRSKSFLWIREIG